MHQRILFCFFGLILTACSSFSQKGYRIAVDPDWFSEDFAVKKDEINAYLNELLQIISQEEKVSFHLYTEDWDTIEGALQSGKYAGMIKAVNPKSYEEQMFSFSIPLLKTGPVLVVNQDETISSLMDLDGKSVTAIAGSSAEDVLLHYPKITLRYSMSIVEALDGVENRTQNAALISTLFARNYIMNLYQETLKIIPPVLTKEGIYLVTLKEDEEGKKLFRVFEKGLKKIKEKRLNKLQEKWDL